MFFSCIVAFCSSDNFNSLAIFSLLSLYVDKTFYISLSSIMVAMFGIGLILFSFTLSNLFSIWLGFNVFVLKPSGLSTDDTVLSLNPLVYEGDG